MKTININQLQSQISRVMKDVEGGEAYEVMRYSRPIAVVMPKNKRLTENRCDECIAKLDEVMKSVKNK
jgi:antitoxin (DNA-binding transcriptional repressor) of toxin-antitoxin stability system